MAVTTLCVVIAALRVLPNRSQFFQYESVTLSCGPLGGSAGWRVKRNTSTNINEPCGRTNTTPCVISELYPFDTGVYWCESAAGECSNAVNITVIGAGSVVLESPVLPVRDGDTVTLRCRTKASSSSNLTADFYKDGRLIRSSSTENLTLQRVSALDQGLYKCNVSGSGESPDGWLAVRGPHSKSSLVHRAFCSFALRPTCGFSVFEAGHSGSPEPPEPPESLFTRVLLPVVGLALVVLVSVVLLCLWGRRKGKVERDVSYTDVIVTQEVQPNRIKDMGDSGETFYSTLQPVKNQTGSIDGLSPGGSQSVSGSGSSGVWY
ncbi:low affinity immunoglobulin gamma Fc region receptor II-a [Etheostoma spectabile]|uniref:low affinity immunoglobulin gamma Fc region receptor II-a n=1 Tax=Etheostoma spectabile TaxID=54343 RepID=UPI0013AE904B|nr:low affinity immunoglobulin gamma Fc region receptor II-a-like [Etheostoma spectabile]